MPSRPSYSRRWLPFVWLLYLGFLFMPLTWPQPVNAWLTPTLVSLPVFLALYFLHHLPSRRGSMVEPLGVALLGFALTPFNTFANVYVIFSAALSPFALQGVWRPVLYMCGLIALFALEVFWVGSPVPLLIVGVTAVSAPAACLGNVFFIEGARKSQALQASNEEIVRLAAIAERERIARDLHDLLGHTLSLIAIKSELAERLVHRDAESAAREISDVKNIARETLKEVRSAVSGIRSAALEGELAAARALLESSRVELTTRQSNGALPTALENTMAMILREAVTNIHRHAGAKHVNVDILAEGSVAELIVSDDGRGGISAHGNGLRGIAERVKESGGSLEIRSPSGRGTVLAVRLPAVAAAQ
jgi:two-component system, NarL family, sensor histidine kinase DesK